MTNKNYNLLKTLGFLLIIFCIGSCTFTTTLPKQPVFKISLDEISNNLKTLLSFDHVNVNGTEKTTNGKSNAELEVDILNGKNVPADDAALKDFTKKIAKQLKAALKDTSAFNTYKILFVTKKIDGAMTKTWEGGWAFKSEDL